MNKTKTYSNLRRTKIIGKKSVPLIISNRSTGSIAGKNSKKNSFVQKNPGSNYTSIRKIMK
jgi:hypothetical protein